MRCTSSARRRATTGLTAFVAAGTIAGPAPAASPADPGSRVFTLAGGGALRPAEGAVAADTALHLSGVAALAGGGVLLATNSRDGDPNGTRVDQALWRLDAGGRLHAVPGVPQAGAIAASPDGTTAYAVPVPASTPASAGGPATTIVRLDPSGVLAPQPVADLAGKAQGIGALAALDDGSIVASDGSAAWRVVPDGTVTAVGPVRTRAGRGGPAIERLLAQPGGAVLEVDSKGGLLRLAADGTTARVAAKVLPDDAFAALPDGTLVVGHGLPLPDDDIQEDLGGEEPAGDRRVDLLDPARPASRRALVTGRTGLGDGDGTGPARLGGWIMTAAATPTGGLLVVDGSPASYDPLLGRGGKLTSGDRVRLLTGPAPAPPVAVASTTATWTGFPHGTLSFLTGSAGTIELQVFAVGARRPLLTASGPAPGGRGALRLPRRLPPGPYDLLLSFAGAGGAQGRARLHVDTTRDLSLRRARRLVHASLPQFEGDEGNGQSEWVAGCTRGGRRVVTCAVHGKSWGNEPGRVDRYCVRRERVEIALDGLRITSRKGC